MVRYLSQVFHLSLIFISGTSLAAPLSLEEIYKRALSRSENLGRIRLDVTRQEQSIAAAQAGGRSRVQLQSDLAHISTKEPERSWRHDVAPQLQTEWRYPLYDAGANRSLIEAERRLLDAAQWDVAAQRELLFLQCAELFYGVLGIEQDMRNLRESEGIYLDRIETLNRREKIGRSRTAEVLSARTQLQLIRSQLIDAEKRLHLAQERLSWLADMQTPFQLRDQITLDQLQSRQIPTRQLPLPSSEAAKARVEAADQRIQTERAGSKPQLDFLAAHRWSFPDDTNTHNLSFGLGLTWLIYDAGQVEASVAGLSVAKQQASLTEELIRREELLNNSLAKREWEDGIKQLQDLDLALKAAQQNVRVQQQEFENGLLTNLEVMQALDTRLQVKRTIDQVLYRTKYVYLEARMRAGLLPFVTDKSSLPVPQSAPAS